MDWVKPIALLLARFILFFVPFFIQAILETAGHVVQNLKLSEKWTFLQDCDDKQACAIDDIHPRLVDKVDCIEVLAGLDDCLIVFKIFDVQAGHKLTDKVFVCYAVRHLIEISEEVL